MKKANVAVNQRVEAKDFNRIGDFAAENLMSLAKFAIMPPATESGFASSKGIVRGMAVLAAGGRNIKVYPGTIIGPLVNSSGAQIESSSIGFFEAEQTINIVNTNTPNRVDLIVAKIVRTNVSENRIFINPQLSPPTTSSRSTTSSYQNVVEVYVKANTSTPETYEIPLALITNSPNINIEDINIKRYPNGANRLISSDGQAGWSISTSPIQRATNETQHINSPTVTPMFAEIPPATVSLTFHGLTFERNKANHGSPESTYLYLPSMNIRYRLRTGDSAWVGPWKYFTIPDNELSPNTTQTVSFTFIDVIPSLATSGNPLGTVALVPEFQMLSVGLTLTQSGQIGSPSTLKASWKIDENGIICLITPRFL